MSHVVQLAISAIGVTMLYLGTAATVCVGSDHTLARGVAFVRILVSWLVPLLGPILIIKIAIEESPGNLRARWWLWPLSPLFSGEEQDLGFAQVTDMHADAERILPGHTLIPPP